MTAREDGCLTGPGLVTSGRGHWHVETPMCKLCSGDSTRRPRIDTEALATAGTYEGRSHGGSKLIKKGPR